MGNGVTVRFTMAATLGGTVYQDLVFSPSMLCSGMSSGPTFGTGGSEGIAGGGGGGGGPEAGNGTAGGTSMSGNGGGVKPTAIGTCFPTCVKESPAWWASRALESAAFCAQGHSGESALSNFVACTNGASSRSNDARLMTKPQSFLRRLSQSCARVFCCLEKCLSNQKHFKTTVLKNMIFILQEIERSQQWICPWPYSESKCTQNTETLPAIPCHYGGKFLQHT